MNGDGLDFMPDAQLDAGKQVAVQRVDPAGTEQAHQVEGAAGLPQAGAELD